MFQVRKIFHFMEQTSASLYLKFRLPISQTLKIDFKLQIFNYHHFREKRRSPKTTNDQTTSVFRILVEFPGFWGGRKYKKSASISPASHLLVPYSPFRVVQVFSTTSSMDVEKNEREHFLSTDSESGGGCERHLSAGPSLHQPPVV